MSKVISISEKLSQEKPKIELNGKEYIVNNSFIAVTKMEEMLKNDTMSSAKMAVLTTMGEQFLIDVDFDNIAVDNIKVIVTAITAAIQGVDYETVASRFQ